MSDYKPKENSGTIFKNAKKNQENSPDYMGIINVDGEFKRIMLWVKEAKNNQKFFSVKLYDPKA